MCGPTALPFTVIDIVSHLHQSAALILSAVTGRRGEALAGRIADRIENRRRHREHHQLGDALRHVGRPERRQHVGAVGPDRQVGGARHRVVIEVPLAVAGAVLVERQIFVERVADAHREPALRLALDQFRHDGAAAFQHGDGIEDGDRAARPVDLDGDDGAGGAGIADVDPLAARPAGSLTETRSRR